MFKFLNLFFSAFLNHKHVSKDKKTSLKQNDEKKNIFDIDGQSSKPLLPFLNNSREDPIQKFIENCIKHPAKMWFSFFTILYYLSLLIFRIWFRNYGSQHTEFKPLSLTPTYLVLNEANPLNACTYENNMNKNQFANWFFYIHYRIEQEYVLQSVAHCLVNHHQYEYNLVVMNQSFDSLQTTNELQITNSLETTNCGDYILSQKNMPRSAASSHIQSPLYSTRLPLASMTGPFDWLVQGAINQMPRIFSPPHQETRKIDPNRDYIKTTAQRRLEHDEAEHLKLRERMSAKANKARYEQDCQRRSDLYKAREAKTTASYSFKGKGKK